MKKIKVLSIFYCDSGGGAAIAANRLNKIIKKKVNLKQLVIEKRTKDNNIQLFGNFFNRTIARRIRCKLAGLITLNEKRVTISLNVFKSGILKVINKSNFDIVHFHSINSETISINEIKHIKKKVLFTAHDMWLAQGIFHYNLDKKILFSKINKFKKNYYNLIDNYIYNKKKKILSNNNNTFVSPSVWLNEKLKKEGLNSFHIPNLLSENLIKNEKFFKKKYKFLLEKKKKYKFAIFVSNIFDEKRKGSLFIKKLIEENFFKKKNFFLILVGKNNNNFFNLKNSNQKNIFYSDYLKNNNEIKFLIKNSDICLFPSLIDNFPNIILESFSVGTPVLAFNKFGMREMIVHKKNGYLSKKCSINSFKEGIIKLISLSNNNVMRKNCKKHFQKNYSSKIVSKKYLELYFNILKE